MNFRVGDMAKIKSTIAINPKYRGKICWVTKVREDGGYQIKVHGMPLLRTCEGHYMDILTENFEL